MHIFEFQKSEFQLKMNFNFSIEIQKLNKLTEGRIRECDP